MKQKENTPKNNKLRSVSKPLCSGLVYPNSDDDIVPQRFTCGGSIDPSCDGGENNIPPQSIFCTNKDMRTYSLMDNRKYIPIVTWKLVKNRSHIISDILIPGQIPHSGFEQRFKLDADSPSMSEKDIGILYRLIEKNTSMQSY